MKLGRTILSVVMSLILILGLVSISFAASPAQNQSPASSITNSNLPAWVKVGGRIGEQRKLGMLDIFIPFMQSENDLWFIDARDKDASGSENEWNLGVGYRRIINDNLILGVYGFFDRLRSEHQNYFSQGTFGVEALTKNLDFRLNAYFPESKTGYTGNDSVIVRGNSINLGTGVERALPGFDAEFGFRIPKISPDIRVFAGGFYFNRSDVPQVAGPRVRTEWRINDLFGFKGTRLTIEGEYTHDNVRHSKGYGGVSVRIPFGFGFSPKTSTLNKDSLEARMIEPIIRDVDIITSSKQRIEPAINPLTDQPYSGIWFADKDTDGVGTQDDPADLLNALNWAGDNGIVAALDSAGTIYLGGSIAYLYDGQTLIGSGGILQVRGSRGNLVPFTITGIGDGTTIDGEGAEEVIDLYNNNLVSDITITNGDYGIWGDDAGNITLKNVTSTGNNIYGAELVQSGDININGSHFDENSGYGARLQDVGDVDIDNSHFDSNGYRGLEVRNSGGVGDVTIANSIANGNSNSNILVGGVNSLGISETNADNSENGYGFRIGYVGGDASFYHVIGINNDLDNYNTSSTITDLGLNNVPGIIVSP